MMRNKYVTIVLATLLFASCQPNKQYTITGHIGGDADGKTVYLYDYYPPILIDSTVISKGIFTFKGEMDTPVRRRILIDNNPEGFDGDRNRGMITALFYMENSKIDIYAHIDSMQPYYYNPKVKTKKAIIRGSKSEDLYQDYQASIKGLNEEYARLDGEYLQTYHLPALDGVFHTEEGVAITRKINAVSEKLDNAKQKFIKENASSMVAYDMALNYFRGMFVELTSAQIDELLAIMEPVWKGTPQFDELKKLAEEARPIAVGSKYTDVELQNRAGETVKLSDFIEEGKYTMLDFWASWCGPCRGEIPHLKEVYKEYGGKSFEIVSISLDEQQNTWEKAMDDEQMTWPQLVDLKGFEGPAATTYKVLGIPYCILLNPKGEIIKVNVRGAQLNAALEDRVEL